MTKLLLVARPQFAIAVLALFMFGACLAILLGAPFSLLRLLLGYLIILPAHLSVSYSNDYFDVDVDKLGKPTRFSGGSGVLVNHPELRRPAKWIAIALILCSVGFGILFMAIYSYPLWFLGYVLVANMLGWFYSAPPLRLVYRGLGELSTVVTAGLLVPLMGYLIMMGYVNMDLLVFVIPLMLFCLAFVLAVEIPDEEVDRLGNKMTWVARRGRGFGFTILGISLLAATAYFFCIRWLYPRTYPLDFRLLGFLSLLPLGAGIIGMLKRPVEKQPATRIITRIVVILVLFCTLVDGYLVYLVTR
jgi:1,4-dihydroxy-2-naphthoate octaprenyltransferase